MTEYSIQYGSVIIGYDLAFAPRKTLGITVRPDLTVGVRAPWARRWRRSRQSSRNAPRGS